MLHLDKFSRRGEKLKKAHSSQRHRTIRAELKWPRKTAVRGRVYQWNAKCRIV